jgi:hypothetical protein
MLHSNGATLHLNLLGRQLDKRQQNHTGSVDQSLVLSVTAVRCSCSVPCNDPDVLPRAQEQHIFGGVALKGKQAVDCCWRQVVPTLQDEEVHKVHVDGVEPAPTGVDVPAGCGVVARDQNVAVNADAVSVATVLDASSLCGTQLSCRDTVSGHHHHDVAV